MHTHTPFHLHEPPPTPPDAPPAPPTDPFEVEWSRALIRRVLAPISDRWFRATFVGAERIPDGGPLILAANHSGNAYPYDGIVLDSMLWRRDGMRPEAKFRTVYEYELSLTWWMRPFGIAHFCTMGLNPKEANTAGVAEGVLELLPLYLEKEGVVAVGEIGYDDVTPAEERAFARQIERDRRTKNSHTRRALTPTLSPEGRGSRYRP